MLCEIAKIRAKCKTDSLAFSFRFQKVFIVIIIRQGKVHLYSTATGSVAQWLGCRSLAGQLFLIYA